MSWSISTGLLSKNKAAKQIDALQLEQQTSGYVHSAAALDQFETAKNAAKEIIKGMAGPYVTVSFTGHANGVGFQKLSGYSNDFISISVYQQCAEDVKHYNSIDGGPMPPVPEDEPQTSDSNWKPGIGG